MRMKWPKLCILWISKKWDIGDKNNITGRGVARLVNHSAPNIKILCLGKYGMIFVGSNKIGNTGVKYLVRANFVNLEQLWLCT